LFVQACSGPVPAQLCFAFPSLRTLSIDNADIADGSLFFSPNAWRALTSLEFGLLKVQEGAVPAIAAALASLPSLRELTLNEEAPAGLAAQMTGLTSLCKYIGVYDGDQEGIRGVMATAARNPGLQELNGRDFTAGPHSVAAPMLQHLLQSCTTLTSLRLPDHTIDQQSLDVLLQYGTCITYLGVNSFDLSASRSDNACSWELLEFEMGPLCGPFLKALAYLPLRGVDTISLFEFSETTECLDHLHVPLRMFRTVARRQLLRAAAVNVAASKAWQICPATSITLVASRADDSCLSGVLHALAPLGGEHIEALTITGTEEVQGSGKYLWLFQAEVEALAASLGSGITSIDLDYCELGSKSWPALARCFPAVTTLSLGKEVIRVSDMRSMHLAMWANQMGHPVTVVLRDPHPVLCMCDNDYQGPPEEWCEHRCSCMEKVLKVLEDFGGQLTIIHADEDDSSDQASESE
jgi:hypothetical protein